MRVMRSFTIDVELAERLKKEGNQSTLINDLLRQHFKDVDFADMDEEQLKAELEVIRLTEEFENAKKEVRNGRKTRNS